MFPDPPRPSLAGVIDLFVPVTGLKSRPGPADIC